MTKRSAWVLALLGVVLALFYSLPFALSTKWGTDLITAIANQKVPGRIEVDSLKLRWFSRQEVKNLRLHGEEGELIFQVEQIQTGLTLWRLLWGNLNFGKTTLTTPELNLKLEDKQLPQASPHKQRERKSRPLKIRGKFAISEGKIGVRGEGQLTHLNATANLALPLQGSFKLEGKTASKQGEGVLQGSGEWSLDRVRGDLRAQLLPAALVELALQQITPLKGLGEMVGPTLDLDAKGAFEGEMGRGALVASSKHLTCEVGVSVHQGRLSLTRPAKLNLELTDPPFAAPFLVRGKLAVLCPHYNALWKAPLHPLAMTLQAKGSDLLLKEKQLGTLTLQDLTLNAKKTGTEAPIEIDGSLAGGGFSLKTQLTYSPSNLTGRLEAITLPLPWIDLLLPTPTAPYLGKTLSCKGELAPNRLTFQIHTPLLNLPTTSFSLTDTLSLAGPTHFTYTLEPSLLPQLAQPCRLVGQIDTLSLPLPLTPFQPELTTLKGQITGEGIVLRHLPLLGSTGLENLLFAVEGSSLADGKFEFTTSLFPHIVHPLISPALPISINGLFSLAERGGLTLPRFRIALTGKSVQGRFIASYSAPNTIGLLFPGELSLELSPNVFPSLEKPAQIRVEVAPSEVIWSGTSPSEAHLLAKVTGSESVDNLNGSLLLDGKQDRVTFDLKGTTLNASGHIQNLHGKSLKGEVRLNTQSLPTGIVQLLSPKLPLPTLIGPTLTLRSRTRFTQLSPFQGDLDLKAESELLKADVGISQGDTLALLAKNRPARVTWTATPAGFKALYTLAKKDPPLSLNEPATFTAIASALDLPHTQFDPTKSALVVDASASTLNLTHHGKGALLENLTLKIESKNFAKGVYGILKGELTSGQKGSFAFAGSGYNLFSKTGMFEGRLAKFDLKGKVQNLQTPILFDLLPLSEGNRDLLNALFGSRVSGQLRAEVDKLSGTCSATLNSENSTLTLNGKLKGGTLTLNKPFQASLTVTPDLGTHLLKFTNPLFISAFRSEQPITLSLDPQGFSLPLFPFTPEKITLSRGELNLEKLWLQSREPLSLLTGLFKGGTFGNEVLAWSTPLYVHIGEGVMTYERMDTLFGQALHCAFWGSAELPAGKVRMNLAILPESLENLLGLSSLPKTPLVIPFKGTLGHLKADWKKATLGIGTLAIKEQGKIGKIVGGALDAAGGKTIPPPTTQPFPWEPLTHPLE